MNVVREARAEPTLDLAWALLPTTRDDFFEKYWGQRPLLVTRGAADYFRDLPGLDAVDDLITATATPTSRNIDDGRLVRTDADGTMSERRFQVTDGGVVDVQDVYRAYSEGYSVVVNRLQGRSSRFALLCRTLELDFHCPVGANLYLSPAESQGFRPHVDTHDVLILQLHGSKQWHIADAVDELPLVTSKTRLDALPDHDTFLLEQGDALYIPRGFPHEALTAGSSSSLHITVSINVYRWLELCTEMLAVLAEQHVELRRALAPDLLDHPVDPAELAGVASLIERGLQDPQLAETAKHRLLNRLFAAGKAATTGHFASIDQNRSLTEAAEIRRPRGFLCRVTADHREARIDFPTNFVAGPARLAPAFRFIADRDRFTVSELPGDLSTGEKVDLVDRLISEGLLIRTDSRNGE